MQRNSFDLLSISFALVELLAPLVRRSYKLMPNLSKELIVLKDPKEGLPSILQLGS